MGQKISVKKTWVSLNGWRGYEEFTSEQLPFNILSGSLYDLNIKEELENIKLTKKLVKSKGGLCRVFKGETSNCCSACYDILSNLNIGLEELETAGVRL